MLKNTDSINHIQRIEFKYLYCLESLNLFFKKITHINENSFIGFDHLKYLELNQNKIKYIEPFSFKRLDKLEELKFERIDPELFETINSDSFSGLTFLSSLQISDADFTTSRIKVHLKNNIFSELKFLTFLHLSNNNISSIESKFFNGMISLKILFLSGNLINKLDTKAFYGLYNLESS